MPMYTDPVAIIFVSVLGAIMLLPALGFTLFLIIRAFRGGRPQRSGESDNEETRMIQEIYHGLTNLEERIESLETLLMDSDRGKRSRFDDELRKG